MEILKNYHSKRASSTKSGPGRYHKDGNGIKTSKQLEAGSYSRGLRNWIKNKNLAKLAN